MRNIKMIQLFLLLLVTKSLRGAYAVNFTSCFIDFRNNANHTLNATGLVSSTGEQVPNVVSDILNAAGFTYRACLNACGPQTGMPTWANISQQFSAWLLPYLALISQLPFGSRHRVSNLMSAILTVGSPVLAGYSIILTILNARWISYRFENVLFPNTKHAVRILISLQQSPLRITNEDSLLSSLVLLPENDNWWPKIAEFLNYTHTWSISSATSIAWVIIAYFLTVAGSLSDVSANINANGQGTGSVWLWLIPIVVGWLQLSPKCDYVRVKRAMEHADDMAFVATRSGIATRVWEQSEKRAIFIDTENFLSPDEDLTPPVYNYARALPWSRSAEDVLDAFTMASRNARQRKPVKEGAKWVNKKDSIDPLNRSGNIFEVEAYCQLPNRSPWASGMFSRMFLASLLPLVLQWATTGAAVLVVWFTPAVGLGCRSLGYILYGVMSTIIWAMLVCSSVLSHYASSYPDRPYSAVRHSYAKILANILRWGGKSLAIVNTICIIGGGMLQFTNIYDNCYCNSSALGRGMDSAYAIVFPSDSQVHVITAAWLGALALGCCSSAGFMFFMSVLNDVLPT